MSVDLSRFCLAQWYGKGEGHQCNYCKKESSKTGSVSYGKLLSSNFNVSLIYNFQCHLIIFQLLVICYRKVSIFIRIESL